jgi:hypothetical protein
MRKLHFLFVLLAIFVLIECSADSNSSKLDCQKNCETEKKCGNIKEEDVQQCIQFCENMNNKGYFDSDYVKSLNKCLDLNDCNKIEECGKEAKSKCSTPDISKYLDVYCDKMIECKATTDTKEQCKENVKNETDFTCMNDKYVSDMSSCISVVSCDKYVEGMMNCTFSILK